MANFCHYTYSYVCVPTIFVCVQRDDVTFKLYLNLCRLYWSYAKNRGINSPVQPPTPPFDMGREDRRLIRLQNLLSKLYLLPFAIYSDINSAKELQERLKTAKTQAESEANLGLMNFDRNSDTAYMKQRHQRVLFSIWCWKKGVPEFIERIRKSP